MPAAVAVARILRPHSIPMTDDRVTIFILSSISEGYLRRRVRLQPDSRGLALVAARSPHETLFRELLPSALADERVTLVAREAESGRGV